MKIAIIGSKDPDSIEWNLNEAFDFRGDKCHIFDIYDNWYFNNPKISKYSRLLDFLRRRYSDAYDQKVFLKLSHRIIDYKPDLVICVYRFIHPTFVTDIRKHLNCKIIQINPDQMTTFEYQQIFASDYDVWFTKDAYIQRFMREKMHLNAKLYTEAFNVRVHKKPIQKKEEFEKQMNLDVMTYGTMYPYRCRMLKQVLGSGINLKIYGTKPNRFYDHSLDTAFQNKYIVGEEKSRLLYGTKIVFNQMHFAEVESVNNRFFEVNGSGAFQLSDYRPILKDLLPVDPNYVSFKTMDEGIEKIQYYLQHPQERYEIAGKVYSHFLKNYTYDKMIEKVLDDTFD